MQTCFGLLESSSTAQNYKHWASQRASARTRSLQGISLAAHEQFPVSPQAALLQRKCASGTPHTEPRGCSCHVISGARVGESSLFQVTLGDPTGSPPTMTGLNGHPWSVSAVPEPSALALAGVGLAGILVLRARHTGLNHPPQRTRRHRLDAMLNANCAGSLSGIVKQ